jgi:hypothetical protein
MERKSMMILIIVLTGIIGMIGLHRTGMFINPVGNFVGIGCGNNVCEIGETKCSCPEDCGLCESYESCKNSYCLDNECILEEVENCCGNQICEWGECGSCKEDCISEECGLFSVDLDETIKGNKINQTIVFDVDKEDTTSYLTFSVHSYDDYVRNIDFTYDCCIKKDNNCIPMNSTSLSYQFFNPERAETRKDRIITLNDRGSVNCIFAFYLFDNAFIPRNESGNLKSGNYQTHCNFFFESLTPEYSVIKSYDFVFNIN